MAKRASTDLSFVVGIDKPAGMTSHDVVDRCRRAFGERRCGHMGTLDPMATGALAVCVGPATRLDRFLSGHDKEYVFSVVFGTATDTDDAQGRVVREASVPARVADEGFARRYVRGLVGWHDQVPPAYSAVKVAGKRSYAEARRGHIVDLKPRRVHVLAADLEDVCVEGDGEQVAWQVRASVSGGTYVRAIARDLGEALGTCAHVGSLRRTRSGNLPVASCVSLDAIEADPAAGKVDPVRLLGLRFAFARDRVAADVECGRPVPSGKAELFSYACKRRPTGLPSCTSDVVPARQAPKAGELVSFVVGKRLKAVYAFDADHDAFRPECVFSIGVSRGFDIDC